MCREGSASLSAQPLSGWAGTGLVSVLVPPGSSEPLGPCGVRWQPQCLESPSPALRGLQESWAGGDEAVWVRQEQSVGWVPAEGWDHLHRRHKVRTWQGQEHEQKPGHHNGPGAFLPFLTGTIRTTLLSGIEDATADPQLSVPRAPPTPNPQPGASCIPVNRMTDGLVLGRMDNMMHQ